VAPYPVLEYRCAACGHDLEAPVVLGGYGDLGARSAGRGKLIHIRALADSTFDEVAQLVDRAVVDAGLSVTDRRRGEVVQEVFAVACDPDDDGTRFVIGGTPRCPTCTSPEMASWTETGSVVDLELPGPTHRDWAALSTGDRWLMVRAATIDALST
jgi:hypothetical protein